MKKQMIWIAPLVLFIFLVIFDQATNYFNTVWFNVKHVLFFGLIIYILLIDLYGVYRFFIRRYPSNKTFKYTLLIIVCVLGITGTVLVSHLQIKYITLYEIPQIKETTYYDRYGHVIYKSQLIENPTLDIHINTNDNLSFSVEEFYEGHMTSSYVSGNEIVQSYYQGEVTIETHVDITYQASYVETLSYTVYKTIVEEDKTTGYIHSTVITNDFSQDDVMITTTKKRTLEVDLNLDVYPEINTIEPQITQYRSTLVSQSDDEVSHIIFEEIIYDEDQQEVIDTFAHGYLNTTNENYINIDFYENGLFNGDSTSYNFSYNDIHIRNLDEINRNSSSDIKYDVRDIEFNDLPQAFSQEDDDFNHIFKTDVMMFNTFTADLNTILDSAYYYQKSFDFNEINHKMYVNDSQGYYHKFTYTDYGLKAEEFETMTFNFKALFSRKDDQENDLIDGALYLDYNVEHADVLDGYDYKQLISYPGLLSNYHFYQHNMLVEHFIIDNYQK